MSGDTIGVFDSGVGGLSVFREIRAALPGEDLVYVADSGHAPYGDRPGDFITRRAETIVEFFVDAGAKAIVVACNTASAVAIHALRSRFPIDIVAIEPAVKPAVAMTRTGVVGVLATRQTIASERLARLIRQHGQGVRVLVQPCPGLAELVECGDLDGPAAQALVARFVAPLVAQGADTIVLGCTHYPFLVEAIRRAAGADVTVIDPAAAVARELRRRLDTAQRLSRRDAPGIETFWTSGDPGRVQPVVAQLWGKHVPVHALPAAFSLAPSLVTGHWSLEANRAPG
ncbi:MAG: glutamate racemase [Betaproteobacteria bacterium]